MILIILLSVLFLSFPLAQATGIPQEGPVPNFTLRTLDGNTFSMNAHRGSVLILVYWRMDQERSLSALSDNQDLFKRYGNKGVQVIGLTADTDRIDDLRNTLHDYGIEFPVLLDPERQVFGDYGIRVYPSTLLINKDLKLAYDLPGHSPAYKADLEAHLRYQLGEIDETQLKEMLSFHRYIPDENEVAAERTYKLALQFTEARLYDQAIDMLKRSLEAKDDIAKSHILLGFLLLETEDIDKALTEFSRALDIDPSSPEAKTGLGAALISKGEAEKAVKLLHEAALVTPCQQRIDYELGRAYELRGQRDSAIAHYREALEKTIKQHLIPSSIAEEYR